MIAKITHAMLRALATNGRRGWLFWLKFFLFSTSIALIFTARMDFFPRAVERLGMTTVIAVLVVAPFLTTLGLCKFLYFYYTQGLYGPPASSLIRVLRFIFPVKAFDMVFSQIVIDFREEHSEMLASNRPGRARWLTVCLWGTLLLTAATWCVSRVAKRVVEIWRIS